MADKVIYGIEFTSNLTKKRRMSITLYSERDHARQAAARLTEQSEPEILEFHLDEGN